MSDVRLWWLLPGMAAQNRADCFAGATKPKLELTNGAEIDAVLFGSPGTPKAWLHPELNQPVGPEDWSELPTPALRVAAQDFAPDMFQLGLTFVSRRLAETLARAGVKPDYREVDCSDCPASVRSMGYRALNVTEFADPIDRERTVPSRFVEVRTAGGLISVWSPGPFEFDLPAPMVRWRKDFVSPSPMFRVPGTGWTLVTEHVAEEIRREGFSDVLLVDLTTNESHT